MSTNIDPARQQQLAAMEQRINEMVQQSRVLEAYMNDIMTRQVTVTRLMEEARLASTTIQNFSSESEVESLMPIGIGVYVKTNVPPAKKLLVNLGASVVVEKSRNDALNYVEARIKEYEVAARQLEAQRQEMESRMEQMQTQINQMLRAAQSQAQQH
ncbi:MAG TPA: prefoldin subunit alpha [Nitrososphaera sp.]|jgi:prefoldin alpha subunit